MSQEQSPQCSIHTNLVLLYKIIGEVTLDHADPSQFDVLKLINYSRSSQVSWLPLWGNSSFSNVKNRNKECHTSMAVGNLNGSYSSYNKPYIRIRAKVINVRFFLNVLEAIRTLGAATECRREDFPKLHENGLSEYCTKWVELLNEETELSEEKITELHALYLQFDKDEKLELKGFSVKDGYATINLDHPMVYFRKYPTIK
ncbi:unnamed protein product [Caenorhabditis sp. 36 PRJEB53466]|nr:unnamed protein product [Caenorhabditis sp. 36 PRJEB53466]